MEQFKFKSNELNMDFLIKEEKKRFYAETVYMGVRYISHNETPGFEGMKLLHFEKLHENYPPSIVKMSEDCIQVIYSVPFMQHSLEFILERELLTPEQELIISLKKEINYLKSLLANQTLNK